MVSLRFDVLVCMYLKRTGRTASLIRHQKHNCVTDDKIDIINITSKL